MTTSVARHRARLAESKVMGPEYEAGMTIDAIAARHGVHPESVRHRLRIAKVEMRPRGPVPSNGDRDEEIVIMRERGATQREIAASCGMTRVAVNAILRRKAPWMIRRRA